MASSDNVLRAGLTEKHVDAEELLDVLSYRPWLPPLIEPERYRGAGVERAIYRTPADEFELELWLLSEEMASLPRVSEGPEVLLCLSGSLTLAGDSDVVSLERGSACLVADATEYRVVGVSEPTVVAVVTVPSEEPTETFRDTEPTRLKFGTSGLRGLVTDMTDLEVYANTAGFLEVMLSRGEVGRGDWVALAGDLRPSTNGADRSIMRAAARAIVDAGLKVSNCGTIPTPALAYHALEHEQAAVMITGSHIPFDRNGIKYYRPDSELLREDEAPILRAVARIRNRLYRMPPEDSMFDDDGMLREEAQPILPDVDPTAERAYVERYVEFFGGDALTGKTVVVYQHSAVGRDLIVSLLQQLGAQVAAVGRSETFVPIDTEAVTEAQLKAVSDQLTDVQWEVGPIDAVVSTDGDSDRPLLLLVDDDERLEFVPGDVLGMLVAETVAANAIAVPVSATDAIERHFEPRGVSIERTRIGSPWVIRAMNDARGSVRVGWEANGGFLLGSNVVRDGRVLRPLPTRDAVLPLVCALSRSKDSGVPIKALVSALPPRFVHADLIDVDAEELFRVVRFLAVDEEVRLAVFTEEGISYHDRTGHAHPADDRRGRQLTRLRELLAEQFPSSLGYGRIERIDLLDGIRVYFDNQEVAHLRASGNAPQMRVYAVAGSKERARDIVAHGVGEGGVLESLITKSGKAPFFGAIKSNVELLGRLFADRQLPSIIGTVSGTRTAQQFWQDQLNLMRPGFGARRAVSFHEDLPVNQAFGLLLLWQRLKPYYQSGAGALIAFVFGDGTRSTPFTETDSAQKPAIATFVRDQADAGRFLPIVELAMRHFGTVESHLRRSGFDGVVVKWGDELQIPTRDLSGTDPLLEGADVVRFVSLRQIEEDDAANKDWVGVDDAGHVTAFIPRRPLSEMRALADRGLLQRRGDALIGGINLGSIAVSSKLLDLLLEEFSMEVNDPGADRKQRPDLDPQFFTTLMIALEDDTAERQEAFARAVAETAAMAELKEKQPQLLSRLRGVVERFRAANGRPPKVVALDFEDQYWGDVGQHRQIYSFYMALNDDSPAGDVSRLLAGISTERDDDNNLITPDTKLGPDTVVENSVLIGCDLTSGEVRDSVLIGTRAGQLLAHSAFDVQSNAWSLTLEPRSGSYRVHSTEPVVAQPKERVTTLFMPDGAQLLMRVDEDADLRDKQATYDVPVFGNQLSFREAHEQMSKMSAEELATRRQEAVSTVVAQLEPQED